MIGQNRQGQTKVKATAFAQHAVQMQLAAHQLNQALADGHAQAGAAKAPGGGRLGLGEAAENARLVFRRDADAGVGHRHFQPDLGRRLLHHRQRHRDGALLGEFDGVAAQVDEHLLQAHGVAKQLARQQRVGVDAQRNGLAAHVGRQNNRHVAHQLVNQKGVRVERHLAGLDFGEVQDVVEQAEQRACGPFGLDGVVGLARGERGAPQQRQHAQNRIHGRANFMAHVGQKLTLRARRFLGCFGGLHQLGNVNAKAHGVAVGHAALDDAHAAPIGATAHQTGVAGAVQGHPLGHPVVDAALRFGVLAAQRAFAHDVFKRRARHDHVGHRRIEFTEFFVAKNQLVGGVKQHKGFVDGVNRAAQQLFAALQLGARFALLGDVGVGGHETTTRHGAATHFQRAAVGPHALEVVWHRGRAGPGFHGLHGVF